MKESTVLAIESSGLSGSAALIDAGGELVHQEFLGSDTRHGKGLLPAVRRCVEQVPGGLDALSGIAVTVGPGSFTGLRVGVMSAKTLAWARKVPIVGVITHEALAWPFRCGHNEIHVANTARRDEVYYASYRVDAEQLVALESLSAISPEELEKRLQQAGYKGVLLGNGPEQLTEEAQDNLKARMSWQKPAAPTAEAVAQVGRNLLLHHPEGHQLHALQPIYPRREGVSMPVLGEPVS